MILHIVSVQKNKGSIHKSLSEVSVIQSEINPWEVKVPLFCNHCVLIYNDFDCNSKFLVPVLPIKRN